MTDEKRTSRRALLRGILPAVADVAATAVEQAVEQVLPAYRRPPGAVHEGLFVTLCTRCDRCVEACPHGAVHTFTEEAPALIRGTPVMVPEARPCHMCEGFPCAQACPERALEPPRTATVTLGKVRIDRSRCIAYLGPECGACEGLCPDNLRAIVQKGWKPQVESDRCVGCGLCIHACPTDPAAIEVVPLG